MSIKEYTNYIINHYNNEILETYYDQSNSRKNKVKNKNLLQNLKESTKEIFKINHLTTELKTGPAYNSNNTPWIHIHDKNNNKGTKGEYLGISFNKEAKTIELWFGFGTGKGPNKSMGKKEIKTKKQNYITKLKSIEPNLKQNFKYDSIFVDATMISKSIPVSEINDDNIIKDLNYLANIYQIYEQQYHQNKQTSNPQIEPEYRQLNIFHPLEIDRPIIGKNILYKGIPGTGKSYTVKLEYLTKKDRNGTPIKDENNNLILIDPFQYETVVFYPEYTNTNFIGSILPTTENSIITYKFIPGPFTKLLKRAIYNPQTNFYLIIEEINRGNAAAIFGELFTLLDRENNGNGRSTYEINNDFIAEDIFNNSNAKIYLPENFSIIATMNSSDQNVIPLDTAFERRWETKWILDKKHDIDNLYIKGLQNLTWGNFRNIINNKIKVSQTITQSEDKKLGAYFINESYLSKEQTNKKDDRIRFANKVLIYLYENVCKYNKKLLFNETIYDVDTLLKEIENNGIKNIFNEEIKEQLGDFNE